MDMFEVLEATKTEFMCKGMDENNARKKAEFTVSEICHGFNDFIPNFMTTYI